MENLMKEIFAIETPSATKKIYSISELTKEVRYLLEGNFPLLWVQGEVSNLRAPSSGHVYFTLKDSQVQAQVRCALFRHQANKLNFSLKEGMQVVALASLSLYEERGDFQLIITQLEETGDGALKHAFETLKKRLSEEGLFALAHKKAIPKIPQCVGVITSPTGAAIHDILTVLNRRFPAIFVIIYPTLVQGSEAARQIVHALTLANKYPQCDVLIIARGGGSLEDLWPFNEECVARAIYHSQIPTISAIGHEIDFTIADFVADQRAATPSAAAELVSPHKAEWLETLQRIHFRFTNHLYATFNQINVTLTHLGKRLIHPQQGRVQEWSQRLDRLEQQLLFSFQHRLNQLNTQLLKQHNQLLHYNPVQLINTAIVRHENCHQRLKTSIQNSLKENQQGLASLMQALDHISPLNTLKRGYAIASTQEGKILRDTDEVKVDEAISVRLNKGMLCCRVEKKC